MLALVMEHKKAVHSSGAVPGRHKNPPTLSINYFNLFTFYLLVIQFFRYLQNKVYILKALNVSSCHGAQKSHEFVWCHSQQTQQYARAMQ